MKSEQNRFLVAVILSGLILFSWQYFYGPKKLPIDSNSTITTTEVNNNIGSQEEIIKKDIVETPLEQTVQVAEEVLQLSNKEFTIDLNNKLEINNAIYKNLDAKENFEAKNKLSKITFTKDSNETQLNFKIEKKGPQKAILKNPLISFEVTLKDNGKLNFKKLSNNGVETINFYTFGKEIYESATQLSKYTYFSDSLEENTIQELDEPIVYTGKVDWAAMDYKYHLLGNSFVSSKTSKITITNDYQKVSNKSFDEFNFFFIKKTYDELLNMGENLHMSIDLGWFSFLAIPILRGLQFIYKHVPNYGWAIILLTLFIRLITSPLQFISSRSMKKMQVIQPKLNVIREKYKDNPQKMQQESMALFKKSGANPMSGCFPLLLQMPIFFAFYKVLYGAVELMGAPFVGWITDLSTKDPYYLLPVLVALGMFLQQKIMPSPTTDPTQKKVMMFLPLIFGFIMKDLPSGLNLYIFVSTIFGIFQQYVILKTVKV